MASTYSTNLALELIGTGDQSGTWGTTTNTNLGTLIEQAISGYVTQAITDGADTTITIPNGATGVARNMFIEMTGALTAARNLIVPANKKLYFIYNNTTDGGSSGPYAVTVKVSGQTGVSVPNGAKLLLVCNGTDVVNATSFLAATVEGQTLTGGANVTSKSLGTVTSGTVTPSPGDRPLQHYTNGGAHTLGVSANNGSLLLDITNNASAGAITTSGFTKVTGDSFTTTNGHKFRCSISIGNAGSLLIVQAMQ